MKIDYSKVRPVVSGKVVMSIDPGDHIGVIIQLRNGTIKGCTLIGAQRNMYIWKLMCMIKPEVVCYEQFALRASMAKKLTGNKFFTCEVIGVIKLYCFMHNIDLNEIFPSSKEYCGFSSSPQDKKYTEIEIITKKDNPELLGCLECENKITEHVRDAYRLFNYYKLFGGRFK